MPSLIAYPPSLPSALVQGRSFQHVENAKPRERDMGESRMRPRYRRTHELVSVSWMYTQDEFDAFDDWYEGALQVGAEPFDLEIQGRGADPFGLLWYTGQFVGEYRAEHIPQRLYYRVSATLRLIDEIGAVRVPPGIDALGEIGFGGGAAFVAPALAGTGEISFHGEAEMFFPEPEALGAVEFSGDAEMSGLSSDARVTDGGDVRSVDGGGDRETD